MRAIHLRFRGQTREARIDRNAVSLDGERIDFERQEMSGGFEAIVISGRSHRVLSVRDGDRVFVWCDGVNYEFGRGRGGRAGAGPEDAGGLVAPMPGRVRRILAAPGEQVTRGTLLLVLEAMKMEHSIRAPRDGVLRRLLVREGERVEAGAELAEIG